METEPSRLEDGGQRVGALQEHSTFRPGGKQLQQSQVITGAVHRHEDAASAGAATRHAAGIKGNSGQERLELRGQVAQHLREGGRQTHVPPAPCGTEHRLHPFTGRLRAGTARDGVVLVHQAAWHSRRGRGRDRRGAPSFRRISGKK